MPYVYNQGVRIHYRVEGEGPPLIIQHPFTDSLETWYELGYVDALQQDYQLILVDARGHGASDKPHEPDAYDVRENAADVITVLDDLKIPLSHYFGYSLGGYVGFGLARYAPGRLKSLIIGGSYPYRQPANGIDARIRALQQGQQGIMALWDVPVSPAMQERLLRNDTEALLAYLRKRKTLPSLEDVLPTMTMPCLLFAGEADMGYARIKACVSRTPNVTFFSLPGLTHIEAFFRPDLVLPRIREFLAKTR
jgi:pimeloyl-ACP methyl ester carboxylesterase